MAHRFGASIRVDVILQRKRISMRLLVAKKFRDVAKCRLTIVRRRNDLDSVAGRENHAFMDRRVITQTRQGSAHIRIFECDALTHFDGGASMAKTDDDNLVLHSLFEPASMAGGEKRVSPQEGAKNDT